MRLAKIRRLWHEIVLRHQGWEEKWCGVLAKVGCYTCQRWFWNKALAGKGGQS